MGRPRAFDETEAIRAAVALFASRAYDGVSVDDLVTHLGVHRNSLYKVFGSKRGLYLAALRWHLEHQVRPLLAQVTTSAHPAQTLRDIFATSTAGPDLDLLLLAMAERAPVDAEVAAEVARVTRDIDSAFGRTLGTEPAGPDGAPSRPAYTLTAAILGLRLRARTGVDAAQSDAALSDLLDQPRW